MVGERVLFDGVVREVLQLCGHLFRKQVVNREQLLEDRQVRGHVVDTAEQQLIIGGLLRGDNDVKLEVKVLPIPEGEDRYLEVEAVLLTGEEKNPTVRVFDWVPKEPTVPPVISLNVVVNNLTMKGI